MAASLTATMPIPLTGMVDNPSSARFRQPLILSSSSKTADNQLTRKTEVSGNASGTGSEGRALRPARKKLSTLEAQRIMAVLTGAIRRTELATVLTELDAERRGSLGVGLGSDIMLGLEEHDVLVESLGELKQAQTKLTSAGSSSRASTASSTRSDTQVVDSQDPVAESTDVSTDRPASQGQRSLMKSPPITTSPEMVARNVALVEQRTSCSLRNVLRAFSLNPSAGDSLLDNSSVVYLRSDVASELIRQLQNLRELVTYRLLTTPVEDVEWSRYLREMTEKERYNAGVVVKLTEELAAAEQRKDTEISRQNDIIRRLQADIHQVERAADDTANRLRQDADKQEAADRKNNEGKLGKLQQDLSQVRAQYAGVLAQHRDGEQTLRKKKFQVETEVENWIQKFDNDMGERQDEYEEIDAVYTEEKKQLNELEERFRALEVEYNRIMDERRKVRDARDAAERQLQTCIRAALTIQAFWRSFKVRKAIKAKKRRGAGKGSTTKKGKK